jgi:methanogenic corrinoid protein MtbC1
MRARQATALSALPVLEPSVVDFGARQQEVVMAGRSAGGFQADCQTDAAGWPLQPPPSPWSVVDGSRGASTAQVGQLVRTLELDVIPRLAQSHRAPMRSANQPGQVPVQAEIQAFAACLVDGSEAGIRVAVDGFRSRGVTVESLYVDLFAPAARHLGDMWDSDLCDFATVTVGLGRLQRLLRELSPVFGAEVEHPVNGRRAMLAQPNDEQHSFGLSMVAEFFRRAGWEIHGGPGGAASNPAARVRAEWFDLVGLSVGSEARLPWLTRTVAAVRQVSRNQRVVVIVGGPIFTLHPEWVQQVGADGTALEARAAPVLAENLILAGLVSS